ncbi:MAG: hypothetical protein JMDDDDMK_00445 [Acidobacteria bacterium]|nr:hypothetical protein [Acidobacteriota bacterium]
MNNGAARIESDGALELSFGAGVVPVKVHFDDRQGTVRFAERVIEFQRIAGCFSRLRHPFTGEREKGHFGISVGQAGVG